MKMRESCPPATESSGGMPPTFPSAASLAALRAWYEGLPARAAVARYLSDVKADGESARSVLSRIWRQLTVFARVANATDGPAQHGYSHSGETDLQAFARLALRRERARPALVRTPAFTPRHT